MNQINQFPNKNNAAQTCNRVINYSRSWARTHYSMILGNAGLKTQAKYVIITPFSRYKSVWSSNDNARHYWVRYSKAVPKQNHIKFCRLHCFRKKRKDLINRQQKTIKLTVFVCTCTKENTTHRPWYNASIRARLQFLTLFSRFPPEERCLLRPETQYIRPQGRAQESTNYDFFPCRLGDILLSRRDNPYVRHVLW